MHYFRIPKLGCYLAVPLIYQNCLSEKSFIAALKERSKVIRQRNQGEEEKEGDKLDYLAKREEYLDNPENAEELKALDDE